MSYPQLPNNRLIVNGVDTSEKFGMIMADGYTLTPPTPKTYIVDIPGGNGKIDLTESLLGDTAYDNRSMDFVFYIINPDNFERVKTEISNFLHGKSYDYQITMDPEYTYHGRFSVTDYSHKVYASPNKLGTIKISVDADPFKHKKDSIYKIDAIGGTTLYLDSGRERVRPKIETDCFLKVIYKDKMYNLPKGTWTINDILFEEGLNEIYFSSFDVRNLKWEDLINNGITFGQFKDKALYEWYKLNGEGTYTTVTWEDVSSKTWEDLSNSKWGDQSYIPEVSGHANNVYIEYKVGDL